MKGLAVPLVLLSSPLASGTLTSTSLALVNEPGVNRISITVDVPLLGADTDTSNLSGTVLVDLDINPVTGEVSEMTVISGDIVGTGVSFSRSVIFVGNYNVSATAIGATVFTNIPPGLVDPATGDFAANQHSFLVNDGALTGSFTVLGSTSPVNFNFVTDPVTGTGSGTGNVTVAETAGTATSRTYDVAVTLPVSIVDSFDAGGGITVGVTASGTVKATGSATINFTPYEFWTLENDIPGAPFLGDENNDGVVNGLVWGLGLAATDNPLPSLPVVTTASDPVATITLPAGGSAAPLVVVGASSPGGPWNPVEGSALSTGVNPIPAGTTGAVTYAFPAGTAGFLRLEVQEP